MKRNLGSVLVVIVGVILAVDIAIRLAPKEATGFQEPEIRLFPEPPVRPVGIAMATFGIPSDNQRLVRVWSDGTTEWNQVSLFGQWRGWEVVPEAPAP